MKLILLIIAVFLVALSHGGAAELTPDSFNEALSGKNLFVKFFAPVSIRPPAFFVSWILFLHGHQFYHSGVVIAKP